MIAGAWFPRIVFAALILAMAIGYTTPVGDPDFYWHANTGRWIAQHGSLPHADPFSYTVTDVNPFRPSSPSVQLILRDYWLGQILLYGVWAVGGSAGIVVLRAVVYTTILIFTGWWLRRRLQGFSPFFLVFLVGNTLFIFPNERPQLFAFLLFPVFLYLLEQCREAGDVPRLSYLLPLVAMAWANIHPSFLLGVVVLLCYLLGEAVRGFTRGKVHTRKIVVLAVSLAVMFINPNTFKTVLLMSPGYGVILETITEYMPPLKAMLMYRLPVYYYLVLVGLTVYAIGYGLARRKMPLEHLLVLTAVTLFSLTATRYVAFMVLSAPLLGAYLPSFRDDRSAWGALLLLVAWLPVLLGRPLLQFTESTAFPAGAARFLNYVKPEENLFNFCDWGGYLAFHAADYKVFIDGRGLSEEVRFMHDDVVFRDKLEGILTPYHVNTVVTPVWTVTGTRLELPYKLLRTADWFPVYSDNVAVVFLRMTPKNRPIIERYQLPKAIAPG